MTSLTETDSPFIYDDDDHSALVMVATISSCVLMIFTLIAKGFVQRATKSSWQGYDSMLYAGGVLMLAQTICTAAATRMGIGKHSAALLCQNEIQKVYLCKKLPLPVY